MCLLAIIPCMPVLHYHWMNSFQGLVMVVQRVGLSALVTLSLSLSATLQIGPSSSSSLSDSSCSSTSSRQRLSTFGILGDLGKASSVPFANHLFDFNGVTYNSAAALGNNAALKQRKAAKKKNALVMVINSAHVIAGQELRGDLISLEILHLRVEHTHLCIYSYGDSDKAGGVALFLNYKWLPRGCRIDLSDFTLGRALGAAIFDGTHTIRLANLHLTPQESHLWKRRTLSSMIFFALGGPADGWLLPW